MYTTCQTFVDFVHDGLACAEFTDAEFGSI